jgi:hypothetical protein
MVYLNIATNVMVTDTVDKTYLESFKTHKNNVCKDYLTSPPAPNYYRPKDLNITEIRDLSSYDKLLDYFIIILDYKN